MCVKAIFHYSRFTRAGGACIVFETHHARVSRFLKVAPPAQAKRPQWKIALKHIIDEYVGLNWWFKFKALVVTFIFHQFSSTTMLNNCCQIAMFRAKSQKVLV